jgi:regulator of replication initiation timing
MLVGINWNIKIIQLKEMINKLRDKNSRLVSRNNYLIKQNLKLKERLKNESNC